MNRIVLNDLFDYGLKIYQIPGLFKFSLDSILLAEYVKLNSKKNNILDLCTGNGAIPLILSTKTNSHIDAFEIQKKIYDLAIKSVEYIHLENQIIIYNYSILEIKKIIKGKKYDIITCNPPYFKTDENSNINISNELAIARHELKTNLEEVFKISSEYLNDKGELYLVHRASRTDEIIILANKYNLNVKNIQFIKTKDNNKPYIVLVRCLKNSKYGVKIENEKSIENLVTYKKLFKEET